MKDLFGNIPYKRQLWNQLWTNLHRTERDADRHEDMSVILGRIQSVLKFLSASMVGTAGLILGFDNKEQSNIALFLNIIAFCIQMIDSSSNLETRKIEHQKSSARYRDIHGEIDRVMTIKRSNVQLTESFDVLSTRITSTNREAPPIFGFVQRRHELELPEIPLMPMSPESSIQDSVEVSISMRWSDNYPCIDDEPVLQDYVKDANNLAHFKNDLMGNVLDVDENCCYFVGLTKADIISASGFGWISQVHSDDATYILEKWQQSVKNRSRFLEKYRFVHDKIYVVYVIAEAYPRYNQSGECIGMEGVLLNVPESIWKSVNLCE